MKRLPSLLIVAAVGGALLGRAKVRLPNQLEISDIGIFSKEGRRWAQLPAEMMRAHAIHALQRPHLHVIVAGARHFVFASGIASKRVTC
jgi:hypothetical protein